MSIRSLNPVSLPPLSQRYFIFRQLIDFLSLFVDCLTGLYTLRFSCFINPTLYACCRLPSVFECFICFCLFTKRNETRVLFDDLHRISVPTLLLNGRHDTSSTRLRGPTVLRQGFQLVKWLTFEKSSHVLTWEEREEFMKIVGHFLELEATPLCLIHKGRVCALRD